MGFCCTTIPAGLGVLVGFGEGVGDAVGDVVGDVPTPDPDEGLSNAKPTTAITITAATAANGLMFPSM
jgi:hypothetical protein